MKVSIIIPVYNVEPFIEECLHSVFAQDYEGAMECVLIDNCSTDNSVEVAERLIETYQGPIDFRLIRHERNMGLSASRNTGIQAATGEFICFIDSDDTVAPEMVSTLVKAAENASEDVGIVMGGHCSNETSEYLPKTYDWQREEPFIVEAKDFGLALLSMRLPHMAWCKLYRREIFEYALYRVGRTPEDRLFLLDILPYIEEKGIKTLVVPQSLYYYRYRSNSICNSQRRPIFIDDIIVHEEVMAKMNCTHAQLYAEERTRYIWQLWRAVQEIARHMRDRRNLYDEYCDKLRQLSYNEVYQIVGLKRFVSFLMMRHLPQLYWELSKNK